MKRIILFNVILSLLLLSGCYSYKDMNRVYFSTLSLTDLKDDGTVVMYEEHFASDRGNSEQGGLVTRIVLQAEGKTIEEAFSNVQGTATYPINYDVKRALGFTEKFARQGIEPLIGLLERDQKITNKLFLYVTEVEPEEFFSVEMEDEKFLGIWLEELFIFQEDDARVLSVRANRYLNERVIGSKVSVLPIIGIKENPTEKRLYLSGAAVFKDSKMVDRLEVEEIPAYKVLFKFGDELIGTFDTTISLSASKVNVTLLPLKIDVKDRIETINGDLTLIYDIKMVCSVNAVEGELNLLDSRVREVLIKSAEETVKKRGEDFYKKFQKKNIDILDVELKLKRKFRDADMRIIDDLARSVKMVINPTIILDGGQNISDTIE